LIFSFEGIDASGKNTQSRMLYDSLIGQHSRAEYISFPDYSTKIGGEILAFLSGKREYGIEARHMLYSANRYEHLERLKSWLSLGRIVIANRYCDSNIAYGVASGLSMGWLRALESQMPQADYTMYLKVSPETSSNRKQSRDRFEANSEYLKKVAEVYSALAENPNWFVIDGDRSVNEIHREILKLSESLIAEGPFHKSINRG
jgi:dTMP kinase